MIERYTRPEMGAIWEAESRFHCLLEVEVAVAQAQAHLKLIPSDAAEEIAKKATFDVKRIFELEATTRHDVIAFVSNVAENVGRAGRYVHYGLTSSDVLDTALSLQIARSGQVLAGDFDRLEAALSKLIREHESTLCAGRTHGIHAEVTTFGFKMAGHLMEFRRARQRVERAIAQMKIVKLSGAVGTYSTQSQDVETLVGESLGLKPERIATQVVPRDRHAEMLWALAITGCAVERLAVELRHLQRTEVGEVCENFARGQKGSSAMPHKRNPISAENLTGLSRLLRANAGAAMENVALWHERDISHSSVERVIFPDSFIVADYALNRLADLLSQLLVDPSRMAHNMDLSQGQLFSSQVLLAMIQQGLTREEAYKIVQRVCHDLEPGDHLEARLLADPEASKYVGRVDLKAIFSGGSQKERIHKLIAQALEDASGGGFNSFNSAARQETRGESRTGKKRKMKLKGRHGKKIRNGRAFEGRVTLSRKS